MSVTSETMRKRRKSGFGELVTTFVQALVIALLIQMVVLQSSVVPSNSMQPSLDAGDHVAVDKYAYGYSRYSFSYGVLGLDNGIIPFEGRVLPKAPKRGDVVVFRQPRSNGIDLLDRVIGLPGDKIQMKSGVLVINGEPVPRTFDTTIDASDANGNHVLAKQYTETLPNGVHYHVLKTSDEGPLNTTPVYEVPAGSYFLMGDNRDASEDSRFPTQVGYVPFENLIGRAWFIYFSQAGDRPAWEFWTWPETVRRDRIFKHI